MLRKFKHYVTDDILELEIVNGLVEIDNVGYELVEFHKDVRIKGTSWVLVKNDL